MVFDCQKIQEAPGILEYLEKKKLTKQYQKAKQYLLLGLFKNIDFRKREPKKYNLFYFKINKQYRAIGILQGKTLKVIEISDHQN